MAAALPWLEGVGDALLHTALGSLVVPAGLGLPLVVSMRGALGEANPASPRWWRGSRNDREKGTMIYELREYTAVPGRLPALVERFTSATCRLFRKHGMDLVFLTRTELGEDSKNEVVYVLRFDSYDDLQRKWAAFMADPEWREVAARSEEAGPLVARVRRRLLTAADFPGTGPGGSP